MSISRSTWMINKKGTVSLAAEAGVNQAKKLGGSAQMLKGQGMLTPSKIANLALPLKKQNKTKTPNGVPISERQASFSPG